VELPKFQDERGFLIEFLKRTELPEKEFGQIYLATLAPGKMRGNHFHANKSEWLCIIQGRAHIALEQIKTKERKELDVDAEAEKITRIVIPPNIAHTIKNTSDTPLVIVAYTERLYDAETAHQEYYKVLE